MSGKVHLWQLPRTLQRTSGTPIPLKPESSHFLDHRHHRVGRGVPFMVNVRQGPQPAESFQQKAGHPEAY